MIATKEKELTKQEQYEILERYQGDWCSFIEEQLEIELWSFMRAIIDSVQKNQRTSVRACHGSSKTITAAAIGVCFLNLYKDSVVITTAPGERQVKDLLWKEIRNFYRKFGGDRLVGKCQELNVKVCEEEGAESYMIGFTTIQAPRAEGYHAPNILWIIDEAKGVNPLIYDAMEGSMTGGFARALEISTTDGADQQCLFRQHHTAKRSTWNCLNLSAFDSPFLNPKDYQKEYNRHGNKLLLEYGKKPNKTEWPIEKSKQIQVATPGWVDDHRDDWKVKRPEMWETKILGDFWELGADNMVPLKWVLSAVNATMSEPLIKTQLKKGSVLDGMITVIPKYKDIDIDRLMQLDTDQIKKEIQDKVIDGNGDRNRQRIKTGKRKWKVEYGVDIARMGDDSCVMWKKVDKIVYDALVWEKKKIPETIGKIIKEIKSNESINIDPKSDIITKVDADGMGVDVFDSLAEQGYPTIGIFGASGAYNPDQFLNRRAEIWWCTRLIFGRQYEEGNVISIPDDPELIEDLTGLKYKTKPDGRIKAEDKEEYKKRLKRSPDKGDALVYLLAEEKYDPSMDQYFSEEQVSEGVNI